MENIETSPQFESTSLTVSSPCATSLASLASNRLQIRCLVTFEIVRNISLPHSFDHKNARIAWSPPSVPLTSHAYAQNPDRTPPRRNRAPIATSNRVLVADDDSIRVYDLRNEKWSANINNGSGGMGKNVHIEFGASQDEILVWSDFGSKVTVWCLRTGRTVEIRDPKFSGKDNKGWGYRPSGTERVAGRGGVMTILCRSLGQDIRLLLDTGAYQVINRVELPTIDAAGLKWSRDGRWIAIWDSASSGYNLHIFTADGHLYRTITQEPQSKIREWAIEGLGIKSVEWVPGNQWLAIGGWDRRVRILSTRTFAPVVYLDHTAQIHVPSASVYTEQVDGLGNRTYVPTTQPVTPPPAPKGPQEKGDGIMKMGISIMAFNADGTLCATRDDSTPSTIWIWDLRSLKPRTILMQHSPVKALLWHPSDPASLLIQCVHDSPTVYMYTASSLSGSYSRSKSQSHSRSQSQSAAQMSASALADMPYILPLESCISKSAGSTPLKWDAKWLYTPSDKKPAFIFGHQQGHIIIWPEGKDQILRFDKGDGEQSDDSLYDILTGRTPIPKLHQRMEMEDTHDFTEAVEEGKEEEDSFQGIEIDGGSTRPAETGTEGDMWMESSGSFEDTFREKRRAGGTSRSIGRRKEVQEQAFDESGLDEMI